MDRPEEYAIILTFGLSLFLQYGALTAVGPYEMPPGSIMGAAFARLAKWGYRSGVFLNPDEVAKGLDGPEPARATAAGRETPATG